MTVEGHARPFSLGARLGLFTLLALILAPLVAYGFGTIIPKLSIFWAVPVVIAVLLTVSLLFGLWRKSVGTVVKMGIVLWTLVMACLSPITLILGLCYAGAVMHINGSCV